MEKVYNILEISFKSLDNYDNVNDDLNEVIETSSLSVNMLTSVSIGNYSNVLYCSHCLVFLCHCIIFNVDGWFSTSLHTSHIFSVLHFALVFSMLYCISVYILHSMYCYSLFTFFFLIVFVLFTLFLHIFHIIFCFLSF